uniref:WAT1-related protein n=1 Tax=Kalanchoe fedtschenkoi TaxID=63787 RepID=A0A7N0T2G2_KALFE
MASGSYWSGEVLPLVAMITVEFTNVGLNTIFKAASLKGMSYHVFIVYSYAVATLVLLPLALLSTRNKKKLPAFTFPLFCRILGLGVVGVAAQVLAFAGIDYSSPTLASAIGNLTPAFTFILAVFIGMEKLNLRNSISQAKLCGTLLSIAGALTVVLYKGPIVLSTTSRFSLHQLLQKNWIIGGTLLATEYLLLAIWYIIQTKIIQLYPSEPLVVLLYNVCAMVLSIPVSLYGEPDLSAWKLRADVGLAAIVYSGCFGSVFSTVVHTWGLRIKGPVYISVFRPLSIIIAASMGFFFLGDNLYLGSVIGAAIISVGFYSVMWGKAKELREDEGKNGLSATLPTHKTPLLGDAQNSSPEGDSLNTQAI